MRPYLAIITDSFRAAFASRILWIVLASITLLLLALAPIGYREVYTVEFSASDVLSSERLTGLLAGALEKPDKKTAAQNIAMALPEELRTQIQKSVREKTSGPRRSQLADAFNEIAKTDDWYSPELWEGTYRLSELRTLDEMTSDSMEDRLRQRRARLRLEAALPGVFQPRPERSLLFTYAWTETPLELAWRHQRFAEFMNQFIFPAILNLLLGVGAVFVGILVTSPIIPEMFQPGSLHLLLSKPISRPALYIAKFVGGCAFVLLCVTLLVSGLWLIAGTRLEIWNHRFFYTIPIFVILFAVYYSVSALAGLHWRSAVVSVAITVLFWLTCFLVVQTGGIADAFITGPATVQQIVPTEKGVVAITKPGAIQYLDEESQELKPLLTTSFGRDQQVLGPLVLKDGSLALARRGSQGGPFRSSSATLQVFTPGNEWKESEGIELPDSTSQICRDQDGGIVALSYSGLFYAPANKLVVEESEEDKPKASGFLAGLQRMLGTQAKGFLPILPSEITMTNPSAMIMVETDEGSELVLYTSASLYRLTPDTAAKTPSTRGEPQPWKVVSSTSVEGDPLASIALTANDQWIVLTRENETCRIFSRNTLEQVAEVELPENSSVLSLHPSPKGDSVLGQLSDKQVFQIQLSDNPELRFPDIPRQRHIESIAWDTKGQLWVVHDVDRISVISEDFTTRIRQISPKRSLWRNLDSFVITPLRFIVPQTGEVGEAVVAMVCGRRDLMIVTGDQTQRQQLDVVRPLATCGAFTVVMLLFGSLYVYRQDF